MSSELFDSLVAGSMKVDKPKSKPKRMFKPFEVVIVLQVVNRLKYSYKRVTQSKPTALFMYTIKANCVKTYVTRFSKGWSVAQSRVQHSP